MPKTFLEFLKKREEELVREGMMKQGPIITVSGISGSGKGEAVKAVLDAMPQLDCISAGGVFRELAEKQGMTIEEFSEKRPKETDYMVEKLMLERGMQGNVVVEGRLSGWVMGGWADVRILVTCKPSVRVERVALREGVTGDEAAAMLDARIEANTKRYREIYNVDAGEKNVYTHIIDNSGTLDELRENVLDAIKGVNKI